MIFAPSDFVSVQDLFNYDHGAMVDVIPSLAKSSLRLGPFVLKLRWENRRRTLRMFLHEFRTPGAIILLYIVRRGDRIGHEFHHCPLSLRLAHHGAVWLYLVTAIFLEAGTAETQAQSPLLRILTSVKITFACHPCESCCIGLLARNPSRIARRKGDPAGGVQWDLPRKHSRP